MIDPCSTWGDCAQCVYYGTKLCPNEQNKKEDEQDDEG